MWGKTPVEFLGVLLPRLEPIRRNVEVLSDVSRSRTERSEAARLVLVNVCACYRTFRFLELPNVIGAKEKLVIKPTADMSWLITVGAELNSALLKRGLDWPPSDTEPPGVTRDLIAMYKRALQVKSEYKVLSAEQLRKTLKKVGKQYRGC